MAQPSLTLKCIVDDSTAAGPSTSTVGNKAYLAPDLLRTGRFAAGDWAILRAREGSNRAVVRLWPRLGLDDEVILISGLASFVQAEVIRLSRFNPSSSKGILKSLSIREKSKTGSTEVHQREAEWTQLAVKESLIRSKFVQLDSEVIIKDLTGTDRLYLVTDLQVSTKGRESAANIASLVNGIGNIGLEQGSQSPIYEMDWRTKVTLETPRGSTNTTTAFGDSKIPPYINIFSPNETSSSSYAQLGGLGPQISQVRSLLELPLAHPGMYQLFGLTPPRGILLHGPPGTGKTALARAVSSSTPGCSCIVVNGPELSSAFHGETEQRLRGVFTEARRRSPCIIVLDEVDTLCPRRDGDGGEVEKRVVATLLTLMDGMNSAEDRIFVVGATNRPNSIDPALRRPGRFDREIEIGIPDAVGRRQIIDILISKMPHRLSRVDLDILATRTHGFVGADLLSVVRESASAAIQRWHDQGGIGTPILTNDDILAVLPTIRPSTMREIFVETASVKWSDIGGQDEVKQKLRECVEWPLLHRDSFKRLGVEAPRGVLLYGPPGCSKTLTAKALATESGLNFIAVKGPELLDKYVGESERAVREIFRKARAASPSIIFFDEIDALGSSRSDGEASHNGVLTSLLNEMDGIEELTGVTVVAATNRPDVLDSALMRPGRLDRILYVGAPDLQTRKEIFRIRLATMAVEDGVDLQELALVTDGCSGAEVASICQDAALAAMNEDVDAPFVKIAHLQQSAMTVSRRITPDMIAFFEAWRDQSGVRSA